MKRSVVIILSVLSLTTSVWYFFIKKYDYQVFFEIKATKGSVYARILEMERWDPKLGQKDISLVSAEPFNMVMQHINSEIHPAILEWHLEALNDSITTVEVGIKDDRWSLRNRLKILIRDQQFEEWFTTGIIKLKKDLEDYINTFHVDIVGLAKSPKMHYAYIPLKSRTSDKAGKMMSSVNELTSFLKDNQLNTSGDPFVEVTQWDLTNDSIHYKFCFPIEQMNAFPENNLIRYDSIYPAKALKEIYYGNYSTSNEAWIKLHEFASYNDIEHNLKLIEIYRDNPHNGGNDREWKAEIYLPVL